MMISLNKTKVFLGVLATFALGSAFAGPFVTAGGKAATPTKYVVTIKSIEFRKTDGSYFSFFSGSSSIDLGSGLVQPGGSGGAIGQGVSLATGTYNGMRITLARSFTMNAAATSVGPAGPAANCATGNGGADVTLSGYTVQTVVTGTSPVDATLSIPPEANTAINGVSGMAIVGATNDLQVTSTLPNFSVDARTTTSPNVSVKFDVANTVEFLNNGSCRAIVLPPTVTVTPPGGSAVTFAGPL